MKNIFLISLILFKTITSLEAEDVYIKVMSARYKDTLFDITAKLHFMGYKMHLFEYEDWNRVYTGPFSNKDEAYNALIVIRKNGANDAYIVNDYIDTKSSCPIHLQDAYIVKSFKHKKIDSSPTEIAQEDKNELNTSNKVMTTSEMKSVKQARTEAIPVTIAAYEVPVSKEIVPNIQNVTEKNQKHISTEEKVLLKDNYFIGVTLGLSKLNIDDKDVTGNLILVSAPDESGMTYGIDAGYYFNESIFMTLNYQRTILDDVDFNDILVTFNYRFDEKLSINPYVGAVFGYSKMAWSKNPLDSLNNKNESSSYVGGIQIGANKYVTDRIALYLSYQYLIMSHTTKIKTFSEEKELEHSTKQNLNVGIKYDF